jgi:cyanate permease
MVVFSGVAPYLAGFIFDTTGSYFWAFIAIMLALVSAGVVANALKKPVAR